MSGLANPSTPRRPRVGPRPVAAGSLVVAAYLAAGCAAGGPRPPASLGPAADGPAAAKASGVTMRISSPDSAAAADARDRYVTLRVEVENRSGGPLLLRPGLFRLGAGAIGADDGGRAAVPLHGISGTRIEPVGPGRRVATDELDALTLEDARRRSLDGEVDPLAGSFHAHGGLSHFRVVRLPTPRMRDAALPVGPLTDGGRAAGHLHFPLGTLAEPAEGAEGGTDRALTLELSRPDGERLGRLRITVSATKSAGSS